MSWRQRGVALSLAAGLLTLGELGLRLAPEGARMELFPVHGTDGAAALGEVLDLETFIDGAWALFERDRLLVWRLRSELDLEASGFSLSPDAPPWHITTDPAGRRGEETGQALVALGDSSTFGWGVNDSESWPAVVGGVNLGVPGYSSAQGLIQARAELPALAPQALVMAFGANDGHYTPWPDSELLAGRSTALGGLRWRLSGLQLVARLRNLVYSVRLGSALSMHQTGDTAPRVSPEALAENLGAIAALAPQAPVVLLDICTRNEYRSAMSELARRNGYALLVYDGGTLDGCHPDAEGHRWLADRIREALAELSG